MGKGIPAPPERKLSKISVRIFAKKSSDFVQKTQQLLTKRTLNFETRGFARPAPPMAGLGEQMSSSENFEFVSSEIAAGLGFSAEGGYASGTEPKFHP
ncbi:MAG: hypothetical protein AAB464_01660, partial [Patescibacteria group bacterium]